MSSAKKDLLAAGGCPRLYGGNIEERASACHLVRFILVSILVLVHCVDSFRDGNRGGVDKELHVFLNKNKVCADPEMESFPIYYISSGRTRVSVVAMSALSAVTTFEWLAIEFEQFERQLGKTSAVFIPHKLEAAAGGGRLLAEADAQLSSANGHVEAGRQAARGMHVGARVCAMIQTFYPATAAPAAVAEAVAGLAMGLVPLLGGPGGDGAAIFAAPPSGRAPADGAEGAASKVQGFQGAPGWKESQGGSSSGLGKDFASGPRRRPFHSAADAADRGPAHASLPLGGRRARSRGGGANAGGSRLQG